MALVIKGLIIWESNCHQISLVLSDAKNEEAEDHRPAIMQDFRDNMEKKLKWLTFWILLVQNLSWVILV